LLRDNIVKIIQGLTYKKDELDIITAVKNSFGSSILVRVEFLGPIQKEPLELEITNLNELAKILQEDDSMKEWLENSAVAVNDTLVSSRDVELKDGDRVVLLPPVCGG